MWRTKIKRFRKQKVPSFSHTLYVVCVMFRSSVDFQVNRSAVSGANKIDG